MPKVNSYTSWQPLEEVIVGRAYPPDYFDYIQDHQVRNQLQQILAETEEDLDGLQKTIETFGSKVVRPALPEKHIWQRRQTSNVGPGLPPLTPRDWQITLGNTLLRVLHVPELDAYCDSLGEAVVNPHHMGANKRQRNKFHDYDCILNGASASCIIRVGRDIFFDNSEFLRPEQSRWIIDNVLGPGYRTHEAITDGHGDAVFAILKPGVIVSSRHDAKIRFADEFPGWDIMRVWDPSILAAMEVGKFKQENFNGRWYVQGQTPSPEFRSFVDTYLKHWTGMVSETVFDVNCLVLDEQHVIFSAYNKGVFDFCTKHRIEPIISELRHSYFWDGGVSCVTQDIRRRGGLETYL